MKIVEENKELKEFKVGDVFKATSVKDSLVKSHYLITEVNNDDGIEEYALVNLDFNTVTIINGLDTETVLRIISEYNNAGVTYGRIDVAKETELKVTF